MDKIDRVKEEVATQEHVDELKYNMRDVDMRECLSRGIDPATALQYGFDRSLLCWTSLYKDKPVCIAGVCSIGTIFNRTGSIWMLGSDLMKKKIVGIHVAKHCNKYVNKMLNVFEILENDVSDDNETAKVWLKWMGFEIDDEPTPAGINGELFRHFEIRGVNCGIIL